MRRSREKRKNIIIVSWYSFIFIMTCAALLVVPRLNTKTSIAKKQLYAAICNSNIQGVTEAVKRDSSIVNERTGIFEQRKPLELAVQEIESEQIQVEICSILLKAGADINDSGTKQETILNWAVENDRLYLAEKLAEAGARPDADLISELLKKREGNCGTQYYFIPQILKEASDTEIAEAVSPALYAAIMGDDTELRKQLSAGKVKNNEKEQILAFAAAYCDVDTLKLMKRQGYDFSWKDADQLGLIHIAAFCNQTEVVKYFLNEGLRGDDRIKNDQADALVFAILGNHPDTVKLLMKEHTDNESSQSKGEDTVWEFVASYGDEKALQSLMESGYRPREQELDDLICDGKSSVVRKALEGKMTRGRIRKEVLLQSAVETGDFPMVQYLVKKGTDMNGYVKDDASDSKRTAMHAAYAGESTEILDYLEENGGDPSKMDSDGADGEAVAREEGAVWNLKNQMIIDERLADGIRVVVLALSFITGIQALLTIIQLRRGRNPAGRIVQEFNRNEYVNGNQILICVPNGILDIPFILGEKLYLYDLEKQKKYLINKRIGVYDDFGTTLTLAGDRIYYCEERADGESQIYEKEIGDAVKRKRILKRAESYTVDAGKIYYLTCRMTMDDGGILYQKERKNAEPEMSLKEILFWDHGRLYTGEDYLKEQKNIEPEILLEGSMEEILRLDHDRLYTWNNRSKEAIEMMKDGSSITRCPEIEDPVWIGYKDSEHYLIIKTDKVICYDKEKKEKEYIAEGRKFSCTAKYDKEKERLYCSDMEMNFYWIDLKTKVMECYLSFGQEAETGNSLSGEYNADVYYCKDYLAVDITTLAADKEERYLFVYDYEGRQIRREKIKPRR